MMIKAEVDINDSVVSRFATLETKGYLAHAYLFVGPAGIGKAKTALAVAKYLDCEDKNHKTGFKFCDQCPSCLKINSGNHPDVHLIESAFGASIKIEQVREVMVDALGVDDDEVTLEATLMGDLGAESIDFLDIVFRLEKAFEIKIPREELFPAEDLMNSSELIHNGKLTEKGLAVLREKMPHTDLSEFEKDPDINKMGDLFTVNAIINYVENKLNAA